MLCIIMHNDMAINVTQYSSCGDILRLIDLQVIVVYVFISSLKSASHFEVHMDGKLDAINTLCILLFMH